MINGKDLVSAGYTPGPFFARLLETANRIAQSEPTLTNAALIERLRTECPLPVELPKLSLRTVGVPIAVALNPENELEQENLQKVLDNMREMARVPVVESAAIMPDSCPAGKGITVGGVIACRNAVIPAAHSEDICCSMYATFFQSSLSVSELMDDIQAATHFGFGRRGGETQEQVFKESALPDYEILKSTMAGNSFLSGLQDYAAYHVGTQGNGNHFAYLGQIDVTNATVHGLEREGDYYESAVLSALVGQRLYALVTHHGSRGLGAKVYRRGLKAAIDYTASVANGIPNHAAWLNTTTEQGNRYMDALTFVGAWTNINHRTIHNRALRRTSPVLELHNQHNFVWARGDGLIMHGKGATPAWGGIGIIPLNMAEPILLVNGQGNNYLDFAPHGAGRNLSRTALTNHVRSTGMNVAQVIAQDTQGLDIRWFNGKADLTETPMAYKSADAIRSQIQTFQLAKVWGEIQPLGSLMAGQDEPRPWEKPKPTSALVESTQD